MHKTTSLLTCHPVHFGCIWSRVCFLRSVWRICVDVDGMWCERGGRNRNATVSVFMAIACIHRSSSLQSAQDRARWRELCTKLARTIFQGWVTGQLAVTTYAGLVRGTFAQLLHSCKRIRYRPASPSGVGLGWCTTARYGSLYAIRGYAFACDLTRCGIVPGPRATRRATAPCEHGARHRAGGGRRRRARRARPGRPRPRAIPQPAGRRARPGPYRGATRTGRSTAN